MCGIPQRVSLCVFFVLVRVLVYLLLLFIWINTTPALSDRHVQNGRVASLAFHVWNKRQILGIKWNDFVRNDVTMQCQLEGIRWLRKKAPSSIRSYGAPPTVCPGLGCSVYITWSQSWRFVGPQMVPSSGLPAYRPTAWIHQISPDAILSCAGA